MKLELEVQYAVAQTGLPDAETLRRWAGAALDAADAAERYRHVELTVRIVDTAESASLNHAYRRKRGATNVLAFALDPPPLPGAPDAERALFGDIAICAPVVAAEAVTQQKSAEAHWAHLLVHGVLHLLGFDHQREGPAAEMERREIAVLAGLGFPDPYRDTA